MGSRVSRLRRGQGEAAAWTGLHNGPPNNRVNTPNRGAVCNAMWRPAHANAHVRRPRVGGKATEQHKSGAGGVVAGGDVVDRAVCEDTCTFGKGSDTTVVAAGATKPAASDEVCLIRGELMSHFRQIDF